MEMGDEILLSVFAYFCCLKVCRAVFIAIMPDILNVYSAVNESPEGYLLFHNL